MAYLWEGRADGASSLYVAVWKLRGVIMLGCVGG